MRVIVFDLATTWKSNRRRSNDGNGRISLNVHLHVIPKTEKPVLRSVRYKKIILFPCFKICNEQQYR